MIKIGTCGFTYKHFKYFNVLEVQETFYDFVSEEKMRKWRDLSVQNNVELTIKANQIITHTYNKITYKRMQNKIGDINNYGFFKNTKEVLHALEITLNEAKFLGSRIIIFQSPSSFKPTEENIRNLKDFFSILDKNYIYGWEPRGEWYQKIEILSKIFSEINAIHVVDPFRNKPLDSSMIIRYYRLHGIGKGEVNYKYKYTDEDLNELKEYILNDKNIKSFYILFNNIYSFEDALRFKDMINKVLR